ncbi:MAG: HU family DNA-binding protein [Planctomycetota bacterium]|nr:HU family DNA-binding protein [Planctomycetota bacterium]MDI6788016.1 HU family DNA-binding protein [Planctomycetota bacterium]
MVNKQELVESMAKCQKDTKVSAERWLDCMLDCISSGLKKDKYVQLMGFGSFKVKARAARKGRNPQTGATITIKASKTASFKPSPDLKKGL